MANYVHCVLLEVTERGKDKPRKLQQLVSSLSRDSYLCGRLVVASLPSSVPETQIVRQNGAAAYNLLRFEFVLPKRQSNIMTSGFDDHSTNGNRNNS